MYCKTKRLHRHFYCVLGISNIGAIIEHIYLGAMHIEHLYVFYVGTYVGNSQNTADLSTWSEKRPREPRYFCSRFFPCRSGLPSPVAIVSGDSRASVRPLWTKPINVFFPHMRMPLVQSWIIYDCTYTCIRYILL